MVAREARARLEVALFSVIVLAGLAIPPDEEGPYDSVVSEAREVPRPHAEEDEGLLTGGHVHAGGLERRSVTWRTFACPVLASPSARRC